MTRRNESEQKLRRACFRLKDFHSRYLLPACKSYSRSREDFGLLETVALNSMLASFLDYIAGVQRLRDPDFRDYKWMKDFDRMYSIEAAEHAKFKYRLICAVNNAVKHSSLNHEMWQDMNERYGNISHRSLRVRSGRVMFVTDRYRFDYVRVVLRPVEAVFSGVALLSQDDIFDLIDGNCFGVADDGIYFSGSDDPVDAVDQLIDHLHPQCLDCGEGEGDCVCGSFVYAGKAGEFSPVHDPMFDFDSLWSRISGARH